MTLPNFFLTVLQVFSDYYSSTFHVKGEGKIIAKPGTIYHVAFEDKLETLSLHQYCINIL